MSSEELSERDVMAVLDDYIHEIDGEQRLEVDVDGKRHTVSLRPVYDFERDIVDDLVGNRAATNVGGGAVPVKGRWIHGWLSVNDEDYINGIWKNYQYFIKYLEGRTANIGNVSTYKRSPGTYDSMYRYLLLLEELEMLERFDRRPIPDDEFDFPIPAEFSTRTYVRLSDSYEDNQEIWDNPYKALYGGEDAEDDEETEIDIEPSLEGLDGDTGDEDVVEPQEEQPTDEGDGDESDPLSGLPGGLQGTTGGEDEELDVGLSQGATIEDFDDEDGLIDLVDSSMPEAMQRTLSEAPVDINAEPSDFSAQRVAIVGPWAIGDTIPGQTSLDLIVSIDASGATMNPGFVPDGLGEHLGDVMTENNEFEDTFPAYFTDAAYDSEFLSEVNAYVTSEQDEPVYYDLIQERFVRV